MDFEVDKMKFVTILFKRQMQLHFEVKLKFKQNLVEVQIAMFKEK